eukprot:7720160-Alexandrium_andersonii.AAC.1
MSHAQGACASQLYANTVRSTPLANTEMGSIFSVRRAAVTQGPQVRTALLGARVSGLRRSEAFGKGASPGGDIGTAAAPACMGCRPLKQTQ